MVAVGLTVGLETVELYPAGLDDHEYVLPVLAAPPIVAEEPEHIAWLLPALAAGVAFTVTTILLAAEQPPAVTVSTKV